MIKDIKNWKDIKDFVNSLTDEQLAQDCKVWGEGVSYGSVQYIQVLPEDFVCVEHEYEPLEEYINGFLSAGDNEKELMEWVNDLDKALKGEIILTTE